MADESTMRSNDPRDSGSMKQVREKAAKRLLGWGLPLLGIYLVLTFLVLRSGKELHELQTSVDTLKRERSTLQKDVHELTAARDLARKSSVGLKRELKANGEELKEAEARLKLVRGLVEDPAPEKMREQVLLALDAKTATEKSEALYAAGRIALKRKDTPRAEGLFRAALDETPKNARVLNELGLLTANRGDLAEAETLYLRATEADQGYVFPLHNLAYLYLMKKEPKQAIDFAERALEIDPQYKPAKEIIAKAESMQRR